MFSRIADLTWNHPKKVLVAIAIFTLLAFGLSKNLEHHLKAAGFEDPASESVKAHDLLIEKSGSDSNPAIFLLVEPPAGQARLHLHSPALRREARRLTRLLHGLDGVSKVENPLAGGPPQLIAPDRSSMLLTTYFSTAEVQVLTNAAGEATERLDRSNKSKFGVTVGGTAAGFNEVNDTVHSDLVKAELIAFPLLALLLLIVFRGVIAASIPLLVGMVSVGGTFLVLLVMSKFVATSIFAMNITTALGLGLAVDYALLLVTRYREELERDGPSRESHRRLVETAGRTVVFSGFTVAAALAALVLLPQRFLYSVGAGGAIVALFAAFGALFLVPSLLALLGERVNALSVRRGPAISDESDGWYRLARGVMRHPVAVAMGSAGLLLLLALPVLGVKLTFPGTSAVPAGKPSRLVVEEINRDYPPTLATPATVVVDGRLSNAQLRRLSRRIGGIEGVAAPPLFQRVARDVALAKVGLSGTSDDALGERTQDTVRKIRAVHGPAPLLVSGFTTEFLDLKDSLRHNLPLVVGVIALTTLILLFMLTGSVVLPLKTLLMNVLTLLGTLGVIVAAFQWGLLDGILSFSGPPGMETSTLVLMFAVIFGLSTDYAVLVLARVKELHDSGLSNEEAVARGLARTGRVVTAAGVCLAAVFLAFTTSSIFFLKEAGIGYAAAVLIDTTLVRALLVPALMRLFGEWNWWAPKPLRRFQARFGFSESG